MAYLYTVIEKSSIPAEVLLHKMSPTVLCPLHTKAKDTLHQFPSQSVLKSKTLGVDANRLVSIDFIRTQDKDKS